MGELTPEQQALVEALAEALRARDLRVVSAESCTGGLIAAACTSVAGSSRWFERGFVTYSNEAKTELLGVPAAMIANHGAVSEAVARAMAEGALRHSRADLSVAVTGIAGPGGAVEGKPVGTVWVAVSQRDGHGDATAPATRATLLQLNGDRAAVRHQTVTRALEALLGSLA
jgi:nicotinamide-nucleotide amidase